MNPEWNEVEFAIFRETSFGLSEDNFSRAEWLARKDLFVNVNKAGKSYILFVFMFIKFYFSSVKPV